MRYPILHRPTSPYNDVECPFCHRKYDVDQKELASLAEGIYEDTCMCCENSFKMAIEVCPNQLRFIHVITHPTPLMQETAEKKAMENLMKSLKK